MITIWLTYIYNASNNFSYFKVLVISYHYHGDSITSDLWLYLQNITAANEHGFLLLVVFSYPVMFKLRISEAIQIMIFLNKHKNETFR